MTSVDKLKEAISSEKPCGDDLSMDGSLMPLELLIKTELDAEEAEVEPDWHEVRRVSLALLERSRDLRVGVILCLALIKLEGLAGFRNGLLVLRDWSERLWVTLFPLLDDEDPEDPTRLNVFNSLSTGVATDTPYRFIKYLRLIPLCEPARLKPYCLRDFLRAEEKRGAAESGGDGVPSAEQIAASFRDTPPEKLQKIGEAVEAALQAAKDLAAIVAGKSVGGRGPNFELLIETLAGMQSRMAPFLVLPAGATAPGGPVSAIVARAPDIAGKPSYATGGTIQSRAEAAAALRAVGEYFRRAEPSSVVPLLIERALRLLGMTFLESMNELAVGSPEEFKKLFGALPEVKKEAPEEPSANRT